MWTYVESGVVSGEKPCLKVGALTLVHARNVGDRHGEAWCHALAGGLGVQIGSHLHRLEVLDPGQGLLLHVSWDLRGEDEGGVRGALELREDGVGAEGVGGPALVLAAVGGKRVQDVQNDDSKVVEGPEAVSGLDGLAILEPLDLNGEAES